MTAKYASARMPFEKLFLGRVTAAVFYNIRECGGNGFFLNFRSAGLRSRGEDITIRNRMGVTGNYAGIV